MKRKVILCTWNQAWNQAWNRASDRKTRDRMQAGKFTYNSCICRFFCVDACSLSHAGIKKALTQPHVRMQALSFAMFLIHTRVNVRCARHIRGITPRRIHACTHAFTCLDRRLHLHKFMYICKHHLCPNACIKIYVYQWMHRSLCVCTYTCDHYYMTWLRCSSPIAIPSAYRQQHLKLSLQPLETDRDRNGQLELSCSR